MTDTPAKSPIRPQVWLAAAVLLLAYALACLKIARTTSPTFDEPDYLAVGYHALVTGQRPYTNINLTFTQLWSSLPLLLAGTPPEIEMPADWPEARAVATRNAVAKAEADKKAAELKAQNPNAVPPVFRPERALMPVTWYASLIRKLSPITLFPHAPHFPTPAEQSAGQAAAGINYGRLFMFDKRDVPAEQRTNTEALVFWSRAMVTALAVALGALVFLFTRRLWGDAAGLVALAFYCLNPQTIALGSFATTDISSTLFFILSVLAVWRLLHRVSLVNILLTGLAAGVLAATKISSLMLLPIAGLLFALRLFRPRLLSAAAVPADPAATAAVPPVSSDLTSTTPRWPAMFGGLVAAVFVAYVTLWGIYGFRFYAAEGTAYLAEGRLGPAGAKADPAVAVQMREQYERIWADNPLVPSHAARPVLRFFRDWKLFPEAYLYDLYLFTTTGSIRRAYIMDEYSVDGWWYFFPVAWLFKTPLPLLAALGAGVALLWRTRRAQSGALWALAPLLVFGGIYTAATLASPLNIGARHLLPLHPLMFVVAGAVVLLPLAGWRRWVPAGVLLAWSLFETAVVHPHHLAYFNQLAGGSRHGHRLLVDSSYEWGEGLPQVRDWIAARKKTLKQREKLPMFVYLSYFGCADLEHYGLKDTQRPEDGGEVNIVMLPSFYDQRPVRPYDLGPGTYIISATMLKSLYGSRVMGPWRRSYEENYQVISADIARLRAALVSDAKREEFLEQEGRAIVRQQAQAQLASADALPREQVIQLMTNALMQAQQWDRVMREHPNAVERAVLLERDGRTQLKTQAQQQLAAADTQTKDLRAADAVQLATQLYTNQNQFQALQARYADLLTQKVDETKLTAFLEQEGRRLFPQQFIQQANGVWLQKIKFHDDLRFSRLCAYLRQREPEQRIGYGLFVFELSANELARAIDPAVRPAEMRSSYYVKGTEHRKDNEIDFLR
jgi:4-amino-4-deoxy-L-arabinose transferase-like glycosyltransferase